MGRCFLYLAICAYNADIVFLGFIMLLSKQGTALVITLLLTVVVMTLGIYTLSKIKPLADNIQ